MNTKAIRLVRITTAPISMRLLITDQPAYMRSSGFDVTLISAEGKDWQYIPDLYNYNVYKVDMARQIDVLKDIRALYRLIVLLKKIKPHIVHTHTPKAGLLGMLAATITGVPIKIHTLAGMPMMTATGIKRRILFETEKLTFLNSTETWPNSKRLMEYIINKKMVPPTKVKMILNGSSNGIDLSKYGTNSIDENRRNFLKNKYEVKDDEFIFLAVGRMVNDKGIIELVEAFLKISSQVSDVRLFLLGPFERGDALPETIVKLITEHPAITHVDWTDEVESFMAFCHCLVHSSHREGFPNVLLQAGAMGVPIICSNIAGNIDIVETESEGYRFTVKDTKDLQLAMETVLRDYNSSLVKASVLQKKIVASYGRKAVHEAIKERYIFLLKEKRIDVSEIC